MRALQDGTYRLAQTASAEDTVRSILLPELTFPAARVFAFSETAAAAARGRVRPRLARHLHLLPRTNAAT